MQEKKDLMEATVFVSNPIIQAKRKMNILGERIFKIGLASLRPHIEGQDGVEYDTEFREIIIPYKKLVEMFGNEFAPPDIKKAIRKKRNEAIVGYIERKTEDGWEDAVPLYSYIGYKDRVGLRFKFNEEWKKDLIELAQNPGFSSYKLKEVFDLSSVHAVRLMELMQMKAGHFKDHDEIFNILSIDFLKKTLMKEEYNGRNDSFRRVVINPAVEEINEKTRYELKYLNVKEGRKVIAYKFLMRIKKDCKEKVKETIDVSASDSVVASDWTDEQQVAVDRLARYKILNVPEDVQKIIKNNDLSRIHQNIDYELYEDSPKPTEEQLPGAIIRAIRENRAGTAAEAKKRTAAREKKKEEAREAERKEQAKETELELSGIEAEQVFYERHGKEYNQKIYDWAIAKIDKLGLSDKKVDEIARKHINECAKNGKG